MKDRYKALWDKIGSRQDKLNSKQDALDAEEDLANFDITEWKKRFLRWMDGNHERSVFNLYSLYSITWLYSIIVQFV